MAKSTVNLKPLKNFETKLLNQRDEVIVKWASTYASDLLWSAWESAEFDDQKFNLFDSFIWIVSYKGEKKDYGFLTDNPKSTETVQQTSTKDRLKGREEAVKFYNDYTPENKNGLEIIFAASIYYAAYLELSFQHAGTKETIQRDVIHQIQDQLNADFGLVNVNFTTYFTY